MAYFNPEQQEKIKQAIQKAEHLTSGEIRVCVEPSCKINPLDRAVYFFGKLKMQKTIHRNGVLIYLAHKDQKFAIIGDAGIHKHAGAHFWDEVKETMRSHFVNKNLLEGILEAIEKTGQKLKVFFPYEAGKPNELSDDIYDV